MIIILVFYLLLGVLLLSIQNIEKRVRGRSKNNLFLSIAFTCMIADWLLFHFHSLNTGFLFEYFMHLSRLYGNQAFILLLLGFGLIMGGLLFWVPGMRSRGVYTKIIYGATLLFLAGALLGKDRGLKNYENIWTSGWLESRMGIGYIGVYFALALIGMGLLRYRPRLLKAKN